MPSSFSNTYNQLFPGTPTFTENNILTQAGKVFIVTGGNAGLGYELVKILYQKGARVYMLSRSASKATAAIASIKADPNITVSGGDIRFISIELSDLSTVKPAVKAFAAQERKLDVLFNNAGIGSTQPGTRTVQGHELLMGVNALAPYLLTQLLLPYLRAAAQTAPANSVRVIFAASPIIETHGLPGGVIISELRNPTPLGDSVTSYTMSKTATWFLASEFGKIVKEQGIVSLTNNPGNLKTAIWDTAPWLARKMMSITMHPPIYGAYTNLWSGLSEGITVNDNGRYAVPWGKWHPGPKEDLLLALKSERDGGTGQAGEFWMWCEEVCRDFV